MGFKRYRGALTECLEVPILTTRLRFVPSHPLVLPLRFVHHRGQRNSYCHTSLVKIDGVNDQKGSDFYMGKKIAYITKAKTSKAGSKFRVVWGKVMRRHGNSGVVRCKFTKNLSSTAFGSQVRVMLYPSSV